MRFDGTVTLITGGSSGIGAATAAAVAAQGSHPMLVGRDTARLERVAVHTGGTVIRADLGTADGPATAVDRALEHAGRIDVLVNNAGIGWAGALTTMTGTEVNRLVTVNLLAPIEVTRMLAAHMRERGKGHIVNVSSIAGHTGVPEETVYSATKGGLNIFTDALRLELDGTGITVSSVVPGVVNTGFFAARGSPYTRRRPRPIPAGRVAEAIVDGVWHERAEIFVPRWMRIPARIRGGFPAAYRTLAGRFG